MRPCIPLKVLFLAFELKNGLANGLNLRMHNIARHFDRDRIQPFLLAVNSLDLDTSVLRHIYAGVEEIRLEPAQRGRLRKSFDALTLSPKWANFWFPKLPDAVSSLIDRWKIDCVLDIAGNLIASLPSNLTTVPVACDLIDAPTLAVRRSFTQSRNLRDSAGLSYELLRQHIYQKKSLSSARFISVVADLDATEIRASLPEMDVLVIPNGVDTDYYRPTLTTQAQFDIAFEGNLSFIPNVDAARYLVEDILPIIHASRPGARLALIGKDPSSEVLSLASEAVTVTGTVDDVRPWVQSAAVFACAMRVGAGIKNKILQAWSMGMPVVCTEEAIPGLSAVDGKHLLVRNGPEQFAAAVIMLLNDRKLATRLGEAGRQHVIDSFSWASQSDRLADALGEMMSRPAGRPSRIANLNITGEAPK